MDGQTYGRTDDTTISVEPICFKMCSKKLFASETNTFHTSYVESKMKSYKEVKVVSWSGKMRFSNHLP
jgi:hypothetical protein